MDTFSERLRERAEQLGISNAEAARRAGLDERRYGHYVEGRSQPGFEILKKICTALGTTPNWLLGFTERTEKPPARAALIERFAHAAMEMTMRELEICVAQAEAVAAMRK